MTEVLAMSREIEEATGFAWFCYSSHPTPTQPRYVFQDRVCLSAAEAWSHMTAIHARWLRFRDSDLLTTPFGGPPRVGERYATPEEVEAVLARAMAYRLDSHGDVIVAEGGDADATADTQGG
jgi:hypothetical protein